MKGLLIPLFALALAMPSAAATRRRASGLPTFPGCTTVTGTGAVTFTRDNGATLARTTVPLRRPSYTYGLATSGDLVLAWHDNDLLVSHDGGCAWTKLATETDWDFPPSLVYSGDRLYVWSENREYLRRIDDESGWVKLKPPAAFLGIAVEKGNSRHVRAGGTDGAIWDSRDRGDTWSVIGRLEGKTGYYRFAFDPASLEHIVAGTLGDGAHVSRDGGSTWQKSAGFPERANVFNIVVSPADGNRVWAMGLDLVNGGRHIYQSDDGGSTFAPVITADANVTLINGPVMAAHPARRDLLYFVFGTFVNGYGTDLYRWDAASRSLTKTNSPHDEITSIAFSTRDPNLIYLGLAEEGGN